MHAKLLTHDNHASDRGGEHGEHIPGNCTCLCLRISVTPRINYVIFLPRTVSERYRQNSVNTPATSILIT